MDYFIIESIILYCIPFVLIFISISLLTLFFIQLQKKNNTFSKILKVWNNSHSVLKVLIIVISLFTALSFGINPRKWSVDSFGFFQEKEINDFEPFQPPNLETSTTCPKEEKKLAIEILKYKSGISSIASVNHATGKLHQALKSQGYHYYYIEKTVDLILESYYNKVKPFTKSK